MTTQKRWTLVAAVLGSGIVFLDSTVVNVALPKIGQSLHSSFLGAFAAENFVYYGYLLSLSALLILAGALNDYFGRRKMFAIGLAAFGVMSLLCGVAPDIITLIVFRVLQGAAGALLVPGSLALITSTFEGEEQGRAFGVWAAGSGATTILGPFVGGILVEAVSWRAVFLINVPLVALAIWVTLRHVAESRDEDATGEFDWLGAGVVFLAVGGLSFGAIIGQMENWHGPLPYAALAIGAVAALLFPFMQARSRHPLVPLELFKSRNFTVTNISTLVIYGALYVTFAFVVIFLQGTVGYGAAAAGLIGIPASLFLIAFSTRFGKLAARYGPRLFMTLGPAIMGLGVLWFARVPATTHPWAFQLRHISTWAPPASYAKDFLPGYVVFGIGLMIMVAPLTTALMTSVPPRHSGVASAINNAISRVGPQLAGALIFVAITASFYSKVGQAVGLPGSSPELRMQVQPLNPPSGPASPELRRAAVDASTSSFHLAMELSAALLLVGAAVNGLGIRNPQRAPGPGPQPLAREPGEREAVSVGLDDRQPEPAGEGARQEVPLVAGHIICPPPADST